MSLSKSQYNDIIHSYETIRLKNKKLLQARRDTIYIEIPRIKEIDEKISSYSVQKARSALLSNKPLPLAELKEKLLVLSCEKNDLLKTYGYPIDFLESIYTCKECKDTGYIKEKKCNCFKQKIINLLYAQSNLQHRLQTENFKNFCIDYFPDTPYLPYKNTPRKNMENLIQYCHCFINDFQKNHSDIIFIGQTGTGKTFLSNCIAKELLDREYTVVYFTSFQIFELFAQNTFHHAKQKEENSSLSSLEYILDCDLLIIDDLGTELINSFTNSQLFLLLNERKIRKKSTIISTNFSLKQLKEAYTERVFSRIIDSFQPCLLYGDDIRYVKKNITQNLS